MRDLIFSVKTINTIYGDEQDDDVCDDDAYDV